MKYMKTFALPGDLSIAVDALGMFPLPSTAHSGPQFFHKPCLVLSQASMEEGRLSHNRAWKNMAVLWTPDACSQVPSARRGTVSPHHTRGPTTWLQHPLPTFLVGWFTCLTSTSILSNSTCPCRHLLFHRHGAVKNICSLYACSKSTWQLFKRLPRTSERQQVLEISSLAVQKRMFFKYCDSLHLLHSCHRTGIPLTVSGYVYKISYYYLNTENNNTSCTGGRATCSAKLFCQLFGIPVIFWAIETQFLQQVLLFCLVKQQCSLCHPPVFTLLLLGEQVGLWLQLCPIYTCVVSERNNSSF